MSGANDSDFDFSALTKHTDAFLKTMYAVRDDFSVSPSKRHIATCINYADLKEMRDEFVRELTNTAVTFVYSPERQKQIVARLQAEGRDTGGAYSQLLKRARAKFRSSNLQGQFSELLLCNLLQHYFHAVPLLRKMPITTNPEMERNGADAIHVAREATGYKLYLGEAKTYDRKQDSLKDALVDAVTDITRVHYPNHRNELDLYTHEDFLPPQLEEIAQNYIAGTLVNIEVHLVCIATYRSASQVSASSRAEILDQTIAELRTEVEPVFKHPAFTRIPTELVPRMNYILFPIREMSALIAAFTNEMR
jgi:hypothetical protein